MHKRGYINACRCREASKPPASPDGAPGDPGTPQQLCGGAQRPRQKLVHVQGSQQGLRGVAVCLHCGQRMLLQQLLVHLPHLTSAGPMTYNDKCKRGCISPEALAGARLWPVHTQQGFPKCADAHSSSIGGHHSLAPFCRVAMRMTRLRYKRAIIGSHLLLHIQGQVLEELLVCGQLLQEGRRHRLQLPQHRQGDIPQLGQAHIGKAELQQLRQLLWWHPRDGLQQAPLCSLQHWPVDLRPACDAGCLSLQVP